MYYNFEDKLLDLATNILLNQLKSYNINDLTNLIIRANMFNNEYIELNFNSPLFGIYSMSINACIEDNNLVINRVDFNCSYELVDIIVRKVNIFFLPSDIHNDYILLSNNFKYCFNINIVSDLLNYNKVYFLSSNKFKYEIDFNGLLVEICTPNHYYDLTIYDYCNLVNLNCVINKGIRVLIYPNDSFNWETSVVEFNSCFGLLGESMVRLVLNFSNTKNSFLLLKYLTEYLLENLSDDVMYKIDLLIYLNFNAKSRFMSESIYNILINKFKTVYLEIL